MTTDWKVHQCCRVRRSWPDGYRPGTVDYPPVCHCRTRRVDRCAGEQTNVMVKAADEDMNGIRCGHCAGTHASVSEIRNCSAERPASFDEGDFDDGAAFELQTSSVEPATAPSATAPLGSGIDELTAGEFDRSNNGSTSSLASAISGPTQVYLAACESDDPGRWAGEDRLGRGLLIGPGQDIATPWASAPIIDLPAEDSQGLARALAELQMAWCERERVVVRLEDDYSPTRGRVLAVEPWTIAPTFTFVEDQLEFLLAANLVDARSGRFTWRWAAVALQLGATLPVATDGGGGQDGSGDVIVPGVGPVWCDGGPFAPDIVDTLPVLGWQNLERGILQTWGGVARRTTGVASLHTGPTGSLAPDQLQAVTHTGGATRIVAPAGSGKTRVLTERLRHLSQTWGYPSDSLTVVAFNRRARDELVDRTSDLRRAHIRTLNSLGLAIVSGDRPFDVEPRPPRPRMFNERDQRALLDELVGFKRSLSQDPAAPWLEALRAVRLGLLDPEVVQEDFGGDVDGLPEVFPRYRERLKSMNALDFDEQIYRAIEILVTDPARRARVQQAMRMVLVDEFQDLTPAHVLMVRLCAAPSFDVFGVGDDDQTIYGYNGADPKWLIDFGRVAPGAASKALTINYRCPVGVVEAARHLLSYNDRRVDKTIEPKPDRQASGADVTIVQVADPTTATADVVASQLGLSSATPWVTSRAVAGGLGPASLDGSPIVPSDIAILTRVNVTLAAVQVALSLRGVPVVNTVDSGVLNRTGLRAALAWLRLGLRPDQLEARLIADAARRPSRALSPKVVEWMGEQRNLSGLRRLAGRLDDRAADKVKKFCTDLEGLTEVCRAGSASRAIEYIRQDIGLGSALTSLDLSRRAVERASHADDLDALLALAKLHEDPDDFAVWLKSALDAPGVADGEGVVLSTVHKVKGQQWRRVVVHGVDIGRFPHALAEDIEEERRVFHVAITRAGEGLTVVADQDLASPFIAEMRGERPRRKLATGRPVEQPTSSRGSARSAGSVSRGRRDSGSRGQRTTSQPKWIPVLGATVGQGGHSGVIESMNEHGAALRVGEALLRVKWGSEVTVDGKVVSLAQPSRDPAWSARALDALKVWRASTARGDSVPAYVVFRDTTLDEIAHNLPATLDELAACWGVGPNKLDRYGDEVLGVIGDCAPASSE